MKKYIEYYIILLHKNLKKLALYVKLWYNGNVTNSLAKEKGDSYVYGSGTS